MKQVTVVDPSGKQWTVRRRWLPWRLRWRSLGRKALDGIHAIDPLGAGVDNPVASIAIAALVLIVAGIVVFLLLPIAALLVELLLMAIVIGAALAGGLFGRPWFVDALDGSSDRPRYVWAVRGWRASGDAVDEVARQLESGTTVPSLPDGRLVESA